MTLKNMKYSMFILLIAAVIVLTHTVTTLSQQNQEDRATIHILAQEVSQKEKRIENLEKDREEIALLRFKDNILKLRHPDLAKISQAVFDKSKKFGFNPFLVMAIIQVESNFNPYAVSVAGAHGLMQINYAVWKEELEIDFNRIYEKEYNIELGLKVLKHYYDETGGNLAKALFHYNNGYKFNNTKYNGKIVSTIFYANRNKALESKESGENATIF